MALLSLQLFGPFFAALDGRPLSFATERARALLAFLAVEPPHLHSRPTLTALLWPDQPEERARHNLRQALLHLRQALGESEERPAFILSTRDTVQLKVDDELTLDVAHFTTRIAACRSHRHRRLAACQPCLQRLREAVELYRGEFLEHMALPDSATLQEWALLKRESLHRAALEALTALADYHERRGEIALARAYAQRQVDLEPWNEEAHQQLMRLLALEGRRSAALAQYEACRRTLAAELSVAPTRETTALCEHIRDGQAVRPVAPPSSLPPAATSFVGREEELAELSERLAQPECRLLTLVGPGGIGKTRLAVQAAAAQQGAYRDGIYFVPLAAVSSPAAVPPAIANALPITLQGRETPAEQLVRFLRRKELLLLLDSMEHLLDSSAFLSEVLQRAPDVVLLVTSQQRLDMQEEWTYEVGGLPCAAAGGSAVELFAQRAGQLHPRLDLEAERLHVAQICRLVDGIPLAIELAASGVRAHSCAAVAAELAHNLDILSTTLRNVPARHRSMRAVLDYSWARLSPADQACLRRLTVFHASFAAAAAAQVTGTTPQDLGALLGKSLLQRGAAGRCDWHQLVRHYAGEKLAADPVEEAAMQERHARYYAAFLHAHEGALVGREQRQALDEIHGEIGNVRAAWQWAVAHGRGDLLDQALGALDLFYEMRNWYREGWDTFAAAADSQPAAAGLVRWRLRTRQARFAYRLGKNDEARALLEEAHPALQSMQATAEAAFALTLLSWVMQDLGALAEAEQLGRQGLAAYGDLADRYGMGWAATSLHSATASAGRFAASRDCAEQALDLYAACGTPREIAAASSNLGKLAGIAGDYAGARAHFERALPLLQDQEDRRGMAVCLHNLGTLAYLEHDLARARQLRQQALAICREIGYGWGVASSLKALGDIARQEGDYAQAQQFLRSALAAFQDAGDRRSQANCLNSLGQVAAEKNRYDEAWRYYREGLAIAQECGAAPVVVDILRGVAEAYAGQGEPVRALELAAFAAGQPGGEKQTLEQLEQLAARLRAQLPAAAAAAAAERGRTATLEQLCPELTVR